MNLVHGKSYSRLHQVWRSMRARCRNENDKSFKYYGGKGVFVISAWENYLAFEKWASSAGYKEGLHIDRIDSNGPYSPENSRWITKSKNTLYANLDAGASQCKKGHPWTEENIYKAGNQRWCKICRRASWKKAYQNSRKKALALTEELK